MKQLLLDIRPAAPATLDNFVVGRNAEALHSIRTLLSGSGNPFIYLWGSPGSGKSHLLMACHALAQESGLKLVIADDVQAMDEAQQIALFNTYNQLREEGGYLISAGSEAPRQMGLRDDLATRLAWGLTYQLHPLSDEEKAIAVRSHARERGMRLPDEVLEYCQRHLRRDLPTLMATLDALDEWSLTYQRPITLPLLKQLLSLS